MFSILLDAVMLFAVVLAIVRSSAARFVPGAVAGMARLAMAIVALPLIFVSSFRSTDGPSPLVAVGVFVLSVGGPLLSFGTVFAAYWRARDVPMREEESMRKPFVAWVPVALLDGLNVVLLVFAALLARG
jgi:hypothetical protein